MTEAETPNSIPPHKTSETEAQMATNGARGKRYIARILGYEDDDLDWLTPQHAEQLVRAFDGILSKYVKEDALFEGEKIRLKLFLQAHNDVQIRNAPVPHGNMLSHQEIRAEREYIADLLREALENEAGAQELGNMLAKLKDSVGEEQKHEVANHPAEKDTVLAVGEAAISSAESKKHELSSREKSQRLFGQMARGKHEVADALSTHFLNRDAPPTERQRRILKVPLKQIRDTFLMYQRALEMGKVTSPGRRSIELFGRLVGMPANDIAQTDRATFARQMKEKGQDEPERDDDGVWEILEWMFINEDRTKRPSTYE